MTPREGTEDFIFSTPSNIDVAEKSRIAGWVRSPFGDAEPVEVLLFLNGARALDTQANKFRQDLRKAGIGDGRCGFQFDLKEGLINEATQIVEVAYIIDGQYVWAASDKLTNLQGNAAKANPRAITYKSAKLSVEYEKIINGYCPICERGAVFKSQSHWLRASLVCQSCPGGSFPRERALALVMREMRPDWRKMRIHESSPGSRGISNKIKTEAADLTLSQYYPDLGVGEYRDGFRNEDLQNQTFPDEAFDIFISLDVLEHVPEPSKAIKEIWRTLKPNGVMICTFPIRKKQVASMEYRAVIGSNGSIDNIRKPEYHGNPVSNDGSIVTVDYGYDVHKLFSKWADFDTRIIRFNDETHGILGEYTEVVVCRKRARR
jgi:hypothetical protein